jgi:thiol:disulfide interchange protein DsbD
LTYVASTQNKLLGFLFLFTYALGLGLIFIALGLSNQLIKALPRSGTWMNGFKFVLGSLMLSAFYYYLNLLLPDRWFDLALGFGLIVVASVYGAFLTVHNKKVLDHIRKGVMLAVLFVGIGHVALGAFDLRPYIQGRIQANNSINQIQKLNWQPYSEELLAQAAKAQKPVIIDFWADWCAACHELEEHTFTDPRVRAMAGNFVLMKFDATQDSEKLRALKKKYKIQGLPTVIFHNPNGVWIDALTLTQFETPDKFLKRMEKGAQ